MEYRTDSIGAGLAMLWESKQLEYCLCGKG